MGLLFVLLVLVGPDGAGRPETMTAYFPSAAACEHVADAWQRADGAAVPGGTLRTVAAFCVSPEGQFLK
mgnify:CR=1 FL=1